MVAGDEDDPIVSFDSAAGEGSDGECGRRPDAATARAAESHDPLLPAEGGARTPEKELEAADRNLLRLQWQVTQGIAALVYGPLL